MAAMAREMKALDAAELTKIVDAFDNDRALALALDDMMDNIKKDKGNV
jgi:4-phosphopantoate--beta-alanine ligase